MDRKIKSALKQNFNPPLPQKKEKFISSMHYPKAKFNEVIFQQVGFVRKRVWLMFIACALFAFLYVNTANIHSNVIATLSAILPFFVLCTTSEIYKSISYNMDEMELACKYNLSMVTLMRTGILGVVSLCMLVIFISITAKEHFGLLRSAMYITVPFLLTNYLSLLIIRKTRIKETMFICAGVCGVISAFILLASDVYNFIYHIDYTYVWVIAFFAIITLLVHCFIKIIKSQEELQWNLI